MRSQQGDLVSLTSLKNLQEGGTHRRMDRHKRIHGQTVWWSHKLPFLFQNREIRLKLSIMKHSYNHSLTFSHARIKLDNENDHVVAALSMRNYVYWGLVYVTSKALLSHLCISTEGARYQIREWQRTARPFSFRFFIPLSFTPFIIPFHVLFYSFPLFPCLLKYFFLHSW
jgi:hypothetical protein